MGAKLVRDKIPEIIRSKGEEARTSTVEDDEVLWGHLVDKLFEEARELKSAKSRDARIEELADVIEVTVAMKALLEHAEDPIVSKTVVAKRLARGGFGRTLLHMPALKDRTLEDMYAPIRELVAWRSLQTDHYGEDLVFAIHGPLVRTGFEKHVPQEHQEALEAFRSFPEGRQIRMIQLALLDIEDSARKSAR